MRRSKTVLPVLLAACCLTTGMFVAPPDLYAVFPYLTDVLVYDFNRTAETPITGPSAQGYSWSNPVQSGQSGAKTNGTQMVENGATQNGSYMTTLLDETQETIFDYGGTFGSGVLSIYARVQNPGNPSTMNCYGMNTTGGNFFAWKFINGSGPNYFNGGSAICNVNFGAVGLDKLGMYVTGANPTSVEIWYHGASGWAQCGTTLSDSGLTPSTNVVGSGYSGVEFDTTVTATVDNWTVGGLPSGRLRMLMGVGQ